MRKSIVPPFTILTCALIILSSLACKQPAEPNIIVKPPGPQSTTDLFLSLSDVHLNSLWHNTYFGYNNDTGNALWARTKAEIEKLVSMKKPKFMVYLGDLPHHSDPMRKTNVGLMLKNLRDLKIGIPLLYLPGNNDSPGADYGSFTDDSSGVALTPFTYDKSTTDPWPILHEQSIVQNMDFNKEFGYYSCSLNLNGSSLNIIALNTVIFCHGQHKYVSLDNVPQDSAAIWQFDWFRKKINSYGPNDKVMIMMHIPPGHDGHPNRSGYHSKMWNDDFKYTYPSGTKMTLRSAFLNEVSGKSGNIIGILTSHTHYDGMRRLYYPDQSGNNQMVGLSISTPGITVGHGNNPGFKFFKYDKTSFKILDFQTHFAVPTLKTKNSSIVDSLFEFQLNASYSFKSIYGGASSSSIYSVISNMQTSDVINNMQKIVAVKSNQDNSSFSIKDALDVYPN